MKYFLLLIIILPSLNFTSSEFELILDYPVNLIEDFWQIQRIVDDSGIEIVNLNELRSNRIIIDKSGEYEVIFKSIFGQEKSQIYLLNNRNKKRRIKYPSKTFQEVNVDFLKNELLGQNEFYVYSKSYGCFGVIESLWKFNISDKTLKGNLISNYGKNEQFDLKSNSEEFINTKFNIIKSKKAKWKSTSKDYFFIQYADKIIKFDSKHYNWDEYSNFRKELLN